MDAEGNTTAASSPTSKAKRGKDQIQWSEDVWSAIDQAVVEEITRSRMAAKFLQQVHVPKKRTTIDSDVVVPPTADDPSLSIDESNTTRIQEYSVQFRLSPAQVEAEGQYDTEQSNQAAPSPPQGPATSSQSTASRPHRASTAVSLALKTANILAQAEDLVIFNGQNAAANSPLFINKQVQPLDPNIKTNLDLGLLNIQPSTTKPPGPNVIQLPAGQVVPVHPTSDGTFPPRYAENTLNAVAQAISILQGLAHYDNYALVLHTFPYADLHQALANTLIEPVEPISHLVTAGIFGTGALPPFTPVDAAKAGHSAQDASTGLPTQIASPPVDDSPGSAADLPGTPAVTGYEEGNVLYTGFLVSLSGNNVDVVRGLMDDALDVSVTFNQKDQNEQYRFRAVQRFALRLKDPTAVVLLLFLDS
jgi:uncharacterized linocin/CFP29 family protein